MDDGFREAWNAVLAELAAELSAGQRADILSLYPQEVAAGDQVAGIVDHINQVDGLLEQREDFADSGAFDRIKNELIEDGHTRYVAHAATNAAVIAMSTLYRHTPSTARVKILAEGLALRTEDPDPAKSRNNAINRLRAEMDACPFCQHILERTYAKRYGSAVVIEPLNPVTPGHLLIVPVRHIADVSVSPQAAADVYRYAAALAKDYEDVNLIISKGEHATQTVGHFHVHLVPRRPGDRLTLPWTDQQRAATQ